MSGRMSPCILIGVLLTYFTTVFSRQFPSHSEIKFLLHVYFPTLNENTTIYDFLSDEKNVVLIDRVHQHSCIDLKRKRKIRSLDWFWNEFTLPINQELANGLTFTTPATFTLNDTQEQNYSLEGKFFNPYSPVGPNVTDNTETTIAATGITKWPTDTYGDRVPKKDMKPLDYINMINNDVDNAKADLAAGGCPLGFGRS